MTTAFEELLSRSSLESFQKFRETLINKGNFSNGNFAKCMDVILDKENNNSIKKITVKKHLVRMGKVFVLIIMEQ